MDPFIKLWILSWKTRYQNILGLQLGEQWAQCPRLSTEAPNRQALHPRSCNEVAAVEQGWSIRSQAPAWRLQGVHPSSPVQTCEDGRVDPDAIPALLSAGRMTLESFWISLCFSLLVCTIGIHCVSQVVTNCSPLWEYRVGELFRFYGNRRAVLGREDSPPHRWWAKGMGRVSSSTPVMVLGSQLVCSRESPRPKCGERNLSLCLFPFLRYPGIWFLLEHNLQKTFPSHPKMLFHHTWKSF